MKILLSRSILLAMFMAAAECTTIVNGLPTFSCGKHFFQCTETPDCIRFKDVCDHKRDCADGTDEEEQFCREFTCPSNRVKCDDGITCIDPDFICDGEPDCPDFSDEDPGRCMLFDCPQHKYRCNDNATCIRFEYLCDGLPDCVNGDDENVGICQNFPCHYTELRCRNGKDDCLPMEKLCNGIIDCDDGADENLLWCALLKVRSNVTTVIHLSKTENRWNTMSTLLLSSMNIAIETKITEATTPRKEKNDYDSR